jgi:hypothetical protein
MALGSTQPLTEMSTRKIPGGKRRPARKADNLTAICEPPVGPALILKSSYNKTRQKDADIQVTESCSPDSVWRARACARLAGTSTTKGPIDRELVQQSGFEGRQRREIMWRWRPV